MIGRKGLRYLVFLITLTVFPSLSLCELESKSSHDADFLKALAEKFKDIDEKFAKLDQIIQKQNERILFLEQKIKRQDEKLSKQEKIIVKPENDKSDAPKLRKQNHQKYNSTTFNQSLGIKKDK